MSWLFVHNVNTMCSAYLMCHEHQTGRSSANGLIWFSGHVSIVSSKWHFSVGLLAHWQKNILFRGDIKGFHWGRQLGLNNLNKPHWWGSNYCDVIKYARILKWPLISTSNIWAILLPNAIIVHRFYPSLQTQGSSFWYDPCTIMSAFMSLHK